MAVSAFADTLSEVRRGKPKVIGSVQSFHMIFGPGLYCEPEEQHGQNDCDSYRADRDCLALAR